MLWFKFYTGFSCVDYHGAPLMGTFVIFNLKN